MNKSDTRRYKPVRLGGSSRKKLKEAHEAEAAASPDPHVTSESSFNPLMLWKQKSTKPSTWHCIDCGAFFSKEEQYCHHVMTHQVLDICYQIQEAADMRYEMESHGYFTRDLDRHDD
ncbi:hypothetical protein L596_001084 [Steinernema carpocapsae]|uniref:C2H2-type domain-containing protein n=1 Tax=Steinernema carpocapsae TaxID=34508 RepID=A0A4U8UMB4_STECR|nr:hypothetical protein L596_001084 [Steinernema carpocapsae]